MPDVKHSFYELLRVSINIEGELLVSSLYNIGQLHLVFCLVPIMVYIIA